MQENQRASPETEGGKGEEPGLNKLCECACHVHAKRFSRAWN